MNRTIGAAKRGILRIGGNIASGRRGRRHFLVRHLGSLLKGIQCGQRRRATEAKRRVVVVVVTRQRLDIAISTILATQSHTFVSLTVTVNVSSVGPPRTTACIQHTLQTAERSCRLLRVPTSRDDPCRAAWFGGVYGESSPSFPACPWQFFILSDSIVPVAPGHRPRESPCLPSFSVSPFLTVDSPCPFISIGTPSCPKPACPRKIP